MISVLIAVGFLFHGAQALDIIEQNVEGQLQEHLLENYSYSARPVRNYSSVIDLSYSAALYQLLGFDAKSESMTTQFWQRLSWKDEFLTWNPDDWENIDKMRFWHGEIWVPDLLPYNEIGDFDPLRFKYVIPLVVTSEGQVLWNLPIVMTTSCAMDVTNFPFDSQKCVITIGSWQYQATEVDVFCGLDSFDTQFYSSHTQWELKDTSCKRHHEESATGFYSSLEFTLEFERMNDFYVLNILLPNAALVALSGIIFFLPADGGERTGYGVTIMLALCVNLMIVTDFIPETSKTIPRITGYFLASILLTAVSLALAVVSINLHFWLLRRAVAKAKKGEAAYSFDNPKSNGETDLCEGSEDTEVHGPLRAMVIFDWVLGGVYLTATTLYSIIFVISLYI